MAIVKNDSRRAERRAATQEGKMRKRRGGDWGLRYKPTLTAAKFRPNAPEELYEDVYAPGNKTPWKKRRSHFIRWANNGKGSILECGNDQCVPCAYIEPQKYGIDEPPDAKIVKDCWPRSSYSVPGWIEEWFHVVRKKSKDGEKEYSVRELCGGRHCELCARGLPRVFGNRAFIEFSHTAWFETLDPLREQAEKHCKCGGKLYITDYVCAECETSLIDLALTCIVCQSQGHEVIDDITIDVDTQEAECQSCNTRWSLLESVDPELATAVNQMHVCPSCNHKGYPAPNIYCTNCDSPDPKGLFDIWFSVKKESEKPMAGLEIVDWGVGEPDARLFDPSHQVTKKDPTREDVEAAEKSVERHKRHIDLDGVYQIKSTREQASTLGKPDPFSDDGVLTGNTSTQTEDY